MPSGPEGTGATAREAYEDLLRSAMDSLTHYLIAGHRPQPLVDEAGAKISVGLPVALAPGAPPTQDSATTVRISARDNGLSFNYSWRNNTLIQEV